MTFETRQLSSVPNVVTPNGSEVRIFCGLSCGSMAQFSLSPGAVSKEVVHRTVEEVWCFIADRGRMWRQLEGCDEIVEVGPGASVSIPVGTRFQFHCDGAEKLGAVGTTMLGLARRRRSLRGRLHVAPSQG